MLHAVTQCTGRVSANARHFTHIITVYKLYIYIYSEFIDSQVSFHPQAPANLQQSRASWTHVYARWLYVSVSSGYVWAINQYRQVYMCRRPCNGQWVRVDGSLVQLDIDDKEVWGVNHANQIYKRPVNGRGPWRRVSGALSHVSASGRGYIWGVMRSAIYRCLKPCNGRWIRVDGVLKQVDGGSKYVYGVNSRGTIYYRPVDGSGRWNIIRGNLRHITASGERELFGVNSAYQVLRCTKPCTSGSWRRMVGALRQCDASHGQLWGVDTAQRILVRDVCASV